ncbi:MAG: ABC transporter substrate-binding protein [Chloroflexi bacterium]|jgi:NitT/TauT family transport system substrate-binding protein|nr:ABC transporter substrate-binding protein [Chloroflexota bacterium]
MKKLLSRLTFLITGCFIFLLLTTSCAKPTATPEMDSFTLPVGFVPNVQFAPFYVGLEKGFFSEQRIDLQLDHSMETDTVALVGADKLPFGICSGEQVLLGLNQGLSLKYILNWYQRYPVGIVSLADANIKSVTDLKGKKVGIPVLSGASYIGLEALLLENQMKDQDLKLESIGYSQVEMLTSGKIDAAVIYVANEPVQLQLLGFTTDLIRVSDSISMIGNGLITNEKTLKENPDLVKRMATALVKSIEYTEENPDEAYEICKKYVDNLANADNQELQKQVMIESIALYKDVDNRKTGVSSETAWINMSDVMKRMGLIQESVDPHNAYTNEFVE